MIVNRVASDSKIVAAWYSKYAMRCIKFLTNNKK